MSESEKKRRTHYRKNREKWIFAQSVIIGVITIAILISSIVWYQMNEEYYIGYTENGSIDYDVYLKENEFYDSVHQESNQSYVASLIDRIIANFSYEIDMDTDDVNYKYSYTIKSRLEIIDDTSGAAMFKPEYELVNVENKVQNSSSRLNINEIVVLNYDEYNDLANRFIKAYSLKNTTSNIVVTLTVDVMSDCNAFSGSQVETYTSELRIPLTTQTVNIKMKSTVPDENSQMIACTRGAGSEVFKTTAIVLGVVDILLILLMVAFIFLTRTPDITYSARVKKIMSQYKSYVQKINNMFETQGYQVIRVDAFDEMLEIRDTIQAPILMFENADKTCTKFMIPTDSKLLYVYQIEVEGYAEPEQAKKEEAVPTTIVKPNITNVVRPVVKVVVNTPPAPEPTPEPDPEPEIETVVEDAEIEIEASESAMPEVEAIVEAEEDETEETVEVAVEETVEEAVEEIVEDEVEEILATIPEVEDNDDGMVEAIDVVWKERDHKVYRYDPDGNKVEEGDVVLVPSRDEANDKDIVREAEVAKGNYKVDPLELTHPLKKIIGVVRRKAENVFTAMIIPAEDKSEETDNNGAES